MRLTLTGLIAAFGAALLLTSCAGPLSHEFLPGTPGFFLGLIHGVVAPLALLGELIHHFVPALNNKLFNGLRIYAEPNSGVWYDVGYVLGVTCWAHGPYIVHRRRGKIDR